MNLTETKSHQHIDDTIYSEIYRRLKSEHGVDLVKTWTERTDPQKYVYEDCGIASYLLALRQSKFKFSTFADIGCGNGLLTYLLTVSGLKGVGIDARARRIWHRFRVSADLRQASLDPTTYDGLDVIPEDTDFLIGNHSDELTPWIPVMAARRKCNFFLLPCCPHDFYSKFSSRPANEKHGGNGLGSYAQYLLYVLHIINTLGFNVQIDKMKIASAKKVCFLARIPEAGLPADLDHRIQQLLDHAAKFKPRFTPLTEKAEVRNCTKLPYEFKQALSGKLGQIILDSSPNDNQWTNGMPMPLPDLVRHLTPDEKTQLKSQCGGLQTFLKNHHQAFQVRQGHVRIRHWPTEHEQFNKTDMWKMSKCWFDLNYVLGCPLPDKNCPFRHRSELEPENFVGRKRAVNSQ